MICDAVSKDVSLEMLSGFKNDQQYFSETRDVFTARLQSYILEN